MEAVLSALKGLFLSKQWMAYLAGAVADVFNVKMGGGVPPGILTSGPHLAMGMRTWGKEKKESSFFGSKQVWGTIMGSVLDIANMKFGLGIPPGYLTMTPMLGMGMRTWGKEKEGKLK